MSFCIKNIDLFRGLCYNMMRMEDPGMRNINRMLGSPSLLNRGLPGAALTEILDDDVLGRQLIPGDVIGITRPLGYEHYAVYAGNNRVIHFAAENGDFGKATIHEAPMSDFLIGQREFFVLDFSKVGERPSKKPGSSRRFGLSPFSSIDRALISMGIDELDSQSTDHEIEKIFSPEETVRRARSVIGANEHNYDTEYDLVFNNCEHFAVWCKTGAHKSYQVDNAIKLAAPMLMLAIDELI